MPVCWFRNHIELYSRVHNLCSVCAARRRDWEDDIYSQLTPGATANLTSSDQCQWFNDAWQIARVFMGSGREASTAGCIDTIALVLNCKVFDSSISNRQSFEQASSAIIFVVIWRFHSAKRSCVSLYHDHVLLLSFYVNTHVNIKCDAVYLYAFYIRNIPTVMLSHIVLFLPIVLQDLLFLYQHNNIT